MKKISKSICCYCGVGCGILIESENGKITDVQGDPDHPANFGRLCTKGLTLAKTAHSNTGRALYPESRETRDSARQRTDWDSALDRVASRFVDLIKKHGPDSIAFYVSGQLLTEDYYVFNKLAKGLVGTNNIDTNSRLCMSSSVAAYKMALGADGPPTCYEDLELADCLLFAGSNMAYAHPVLLRRLEDARAKRPHVKWIVVDPRRTDTATLADLHLQIQPGTDVALFNGMLHYLIWEELIAPEYIATHTEGFSELKRLVREYTPRMAAEICGISETDLIQAAEWFGRSSATLSLYCMGLNQSAQGTNKNLALINLHLATGHIGRPGAGPFSLTGQPNAMGGREVGGMATMLAAHRDIQNAEHRDEVARFWGVSKLSDKPGTPAVAMFQALKEGRIKAIYIACTNPAHSMPNLPEVRKALQTAEFVVLQDAFSNTDTADYADVLLPATSWGEKDGTVTNSERCISRVRSAVNGPDGAKHDWWIASEIARRMEKLLRPGLTSLFPYKESQTIFEEHRALTVGRDLDIGGLSYKILEDTGPQQWPFPVGSSKGQPRRYTDSRFATPNGRAIFHPTPYLPVAEQTNARFPYHLLTGRLRDQWHGMSRTGRIAELFSHTPSPGITMRPQDAERRGLKVDQLVQITSKRGKLVLPLVLSDDVPSGCVFVPMHWSGQFLNTCGINEVSIDTVDSKSFQPELKHSSVRIEPVELPWRVILGLKNKNNLAIHNSLQPLLTECDYASISLHANDVIVLRAAAKEAMNEWLTKLFLQTELLPCVDVLEYRDDRRGVFKRAKWHEDKLSGFVFAGDINGGESLLSDLTEGRPWQGSRLKVFSSSTNAITRDKLICNCKLVKESQIVNMSSNGAPLNEIKNTLGCGSVCGSCLPEVKRICCATWRIAENELEANKLKVTSKN